MPKDPLIEAEKKFNKAELFFNADQFKKAGKLFNSAADSFFKQKEYNSARECYNNAASSYIHLKRYSLAIGALRNAGDCSLFINEYSDANRFFKKVINYLPDYKKTADRDYLYILFSSLSYLCLFVEGKQDQGLDFIKQIKKNVDSGFFKESPTISLVKNLTIAVRDKNKDYLDKVIESFKKYDFHIAEEKLLREVLVAAKSIISLEIKLSLDKEQYTTKDIINLKIDVNTQPLLAISQNSFYNYNIERIKITNIGLNLSENIIAQKKPNLPVTINAGESYEFEILLKSHFQVDEPFIGPISLNCEMDDKFMFLLQEKEVIKPNIISPPPSLDISIKNLRPPLIGKTFPLEILIKNSSQGDALEFNINIEFPKELKIMRGTTKKQVYSLSSNDNITWEINLKPLEAGDYIIKMDLSFKDPDQNLIEEEKTFPFSIKL
ncbi:MAG: hypothetical protein EU540_00785 [Promethearchaeota archaeon]|nr:MAG: hypothetical protein EU540_00785 [Candidatus Lokiarchaeota archaeon]